MSAPETVTEYGRRKAIAKLHVAKTRLALTDDSYRAILRRVAGIDSAANATDAQLAALLTEMRRLGFADRQRSEEPQVRKIYALWQALEPHLRNSSEAALFTFCERVTGVSRPEWLGPLKANQVIEALKSWQRRIEGGTK